ncbi:DUF2125 domain-containing protein [Rhodophyticola sp. CCM32]|uniref:DUF2125 domain-containing protein n=1 Tax=Rhodophyticola sp. CCM32 TaxID=2916397 RepID=UPI00143CF067|nr:DUF2125 domain-containing protein [Rhodophyticola sp. CCM32]
MAVIAASPAFADVDAQELWAEWQAQTAFSGQTLTADSVTETATGLVITGLTSTSVQGETTSTGQIDQVTLTENDDGTLSVGLSEVYRITSNTQVQNAPPVSVVMDMRHEGLTITVSGDPGARQYDYSADALSVTTDQISIAGDTGGDLDISATVNDLLVQYNITGDTPETTSFTSTGGFSSATGTVDASSSGGTPGSFKMSFNMGATTSSGSGTLSSMAAMSQISSGAALPEDFNLEGQADYERLSYEVTFEEPETSFHMTFANEGGNMAVAFAEGGLTYDLSAQNVDATVQTSEFPLPIEVSAASTGFLLTLPLMPQPDPSDMALRLDYQELEVNDALWAMIDPGAAIPRDPASLIVDITGKVQMFVNLMAGDPAALQGPPGELREVTLNELQLSLAGASLEGEGDLDFAAGQVIPMPVGTIDLRAAGLSALLERLTTAGLLPEEQAAMARGVSGMFARPGPSPDTLETTIEFLPGGGITANGIPLQ